MKQEEDLPIFTKLDKSFDEVLISLVHEHEGLYNNDSKMFKDSVARASSWNSIATCLNSSSDECLKRWLMLRKQFLRAERYMREAKTSGQSGRKISNFRFKEAMLWYRPYIKGYGPWMNPKVIRSSLLPVVSGSLPRRIAPAPSPPSTPTPEAAAFLSTPLQPPEFIPIPSLGPSTPYLCGNLYQTVSPPVNILEAASPSNTSPTSLELIRPDSSSAPRGVVSLLPQAEDPEGLVGVLRSSLQAFNSLCGEKRMETTDQDDDFGKCIAAELKKLGRRDKIDAKCRILTIFKDYDEHYEK